MQVEKPERRVRAALSFASSGSRRLRSAALMVWAAALSSPLVAQQPAPLSSLLRVYLENESGAPVAGAEVTIRWGRNERVVRADSAGLARFDDLRTGDIEIFVRRLGMNAVTLQTKVQQGENAVTVFVDDSPTVLDERKVTDSRPVKGRHEDFAMRLKRREASAVVTQDQIDKRNPVKLSTMLRGIPGLRIADSLGQTVAISTRGMKPVLGKPVDCVMRVMVDGISMPAAISLDALVPNEVFGIEVFNGAARIPPSMSATRTDTWCGVIAIWTR